VSKGLWIPEGKRLEIRMPHQLHGPPPHLLATAKFTQRKIPPLYKGGGDE